jgi:hypothetical protein
MRLDLTGSDSFEPLEILGKIYVPEPDKSKRIVDAPAPRRLPRAPPTPAAASAGAAHAFLWRYSYKRLKLAQLLGRHGVVRTCAAAAAAASAAASMRRRSIRVCCRRAWARVTIDQFRHLALQTGQGHRASTSILANQNVQICIEVRTIVHTIGLSTWIRSSRSTRLPGARNHVLTPHAAMQRTIL